MMRCALLLGALLLAGCQTDLALVDLKERYGGPPSRFLPMDGIEVHWRDEGPGASARTDAVPAAAASAGAAGAPAPGSDPAAAAVAPTPTPAPVFESSMPSAPAPAPDPAPAAATADPSAPPSAAPGVGTPPVRAASPAPGSLTEPPTILLLHGTGASLHTWDGWVEVMARSFRVVRLDLPGFGLTGPYPSGDYSAAAMTDFLERFAAAAGLRRFAVAGNSLGGYYAWRYALRHPEQVSALVLVDSGGYPIPTSASSSVALQLARMPVVSELLRWAPIRGAVRRSLLDVYVDDSKVTPALVDRYTDLMRRPGNRAAFGDRARRASRPEDYQRLPELRVPTLILWGEQDQWIPVAHAERFHAAIPDSRLVRYPDLGHLPMEEDPARTARDVMEFLRRTMPEAAARGQPPQK
jgi:pimeloyl-ACP methyl ester carboxylesterase